LQKRVFLRDATGIVREMAAFDVLIFGVFMTCYGLAFATGFTSIEGALPGVDMAASYLLLIPCCLALGLVYTWMSQIMPRSGGDYIWISRVIHPAFALGLSLVWVYFQSVASGLFAALIGETALGSGLGTLGMQMTSSGLTNLGTFFSGVPGTLAVGTVVILVCFGLLLVPLRIYLKVQLALWLVGMASIVIFFAVYTTVSPSQFVNSFNSFYAPYNITYTGTISTASSAGFNNPGLVEGVVLAIMGMVLGYFYINGFQFGAYVSGEVKNVRKSMYVSSVVGVVVGLLMFALAGYLVQRIEGPTFLNAISYIEAVNPSLFNAPVLFNPYLIAGVLANSPVITVILIIGLIAWLFELFVCFGLTISRIMLAWGFDRLVSTKLANVSDRTHTPVVAAVAYTVLIELRLLATLYFGTIVAQLNMGIVLCLLYTVVGVVAVVLPWRRKSLFSASPLSNWKVVGVPVISVGGAIVAIVFGALTVVGFVYPALIGPMGTVSIGIIIGIWLVGAAWYAADYWYYKRRGIDLRFQFSEIPPE